MLLYFGSFVVPGVSGVTVYLDHENPKKFYCVREVPKLTMDAATGEPMLYYTSIKRDARVTLSDSVNLGYMTVTVDIGITKDEEAKIRDFIFKNYSSTVQKTFDALMKLNPDEKDNNRTNKLTLRSADEIEIGTINWKEGTAQLELLENVGGEDSSFKTYGTGKTIPSLFGNCHASFSESFSSEGDLLMRSLLNMDGGDKKRAINMGALVRYDLYGFAYLPSMQVKINVNTEKLYDYFKRDRDLTEDDANHKGGFRSTYKNSEGKMETIEIYGYDDIEADTAQLAQSLSGAITVTIEDYSGMVSDKLSEWGNQIVNAYISAITDAIIPKLFTEIKDPEILTQIQSTKTEDPNAEPEIKDKDEDGDRTRFFHITDSRSDKSNFDLVFTKSCTIPYHVAPQGTLMINGLTDEQKKNVCTEADIADDTFQGMNIPVQVSANFQEDNIFAIEVDVVYKHYNAVTGKDRVASATYQFKTGDESFNFRVTKAKDEKGRYQESYKVRSRILFKNQNEYFGGGDGWSDWETLTEKILTISYGKIGFLRTEISPANFDPNVIKEAVVHLKYLGANESDTEGDVRLTPDSGMMSWKCFKYRKSDNDYQYSVKYFYLDGTVYETAPVTTVADSITIVDPFVKPVSADFYVKMGANISSVKIEVEFKDGKYEKRSSHVVTPEEAMQPWNWGIKIRKDAKESIRYRYIVFYSSDTDPYQSDWIEASAKNETIYIKAVSDPNAKPEVEKEATQLTIDSSMLQWDKWKRVYVIIKDDSGKSKTLPLNAEEPITTVDVTYTSDGKKVCICSCQFLPMKGTVQKTDPVECRDLFIIEEPKTEEELKKEEAPKTEEA